MSKAPLPLKPVPLVNGDGQNLSVCPKCHGSGTHYLGTRNSKNEAGFIRTETRDFRPAEVKQAAKLKREGWVIESSKCKHCNGSGMVLSKDPQTW